MLGVRSPVDARPVAGGPGGAAPRPATAERLFRVAVAAAVVPIVVATVRAARQGWLPIGDNAYFAIRARDVLTEHHPLLGTWTSASLTAGTNFNNPGPLLFDLLAPAAKLFDAGVGVAVGAALLNALSVAGIALVARRRGGPVLGVAGALTAATLSWSMGSELLFDPWQPHSLLLPALLLLTLVWSLADGDVVALPWAVAVGSVIVQTHLSYAVLVAATGAVGAAGLALALRRDRRRAPASWRRRRREVGRLSAVAAVVLALCWAQPLAEQVAGEGEGNLSRLVQHAGGAPVTIGPDLGTRLAARVVALPPWWLRPSFDDALDPSLEAAVDPDLGARVPDVASTAASVVSLAAVVAVLGACWFVAGRRRDRTGGAAVVTAAVAIAAGVATAASLPVGAVGIAPHQLRFLWPIAAFATLAVVACLAPPLAGRARRDVTTAALTVLVAVVAAANLPTHRSSAGPANDAWAIPVMRELAAQMGALEGEGPLLIDMERIRFAEPYSGPVMAELQRRGIPFVVEDEGMVRQLGSSRRAPAGARRLLIREGAATREPVAGGRRAALVEGLTPAEQAELDQLGRELVGHFRDLGRVPLDARGRAVSAAGRLPLLQARPDVLTAEPEALVTTRTLAFLAGEELLDLDGPWAARAARYADLQHRADYETVALFVVPAERPRS